MVHPPASVGDERSWRSPVLLPTLRLPNRQLLLIQASSLEDRAAELRWGLPVHLAKDEKLSLEPSAEAQDTAASVLRAVLRQLRPLAAHLGLRVRAMRWSAGPGDVGCFEDHRPG
eukprot:g18911.t1